MEIMTTRRWVAVAIVGCAALATLLLPPGEDSSERGYRAHRRPESLTEQSLKGRISELVAAREVLSRREALLRAPVEPGRSGPRVVVMTQLSEAEQASIQKAVGEHAAAIGRGTDALVVGVVLDTITSLPTASNFRTERQFILPAAADGGRCVTIIRLGRGKRHVEPHVARGILGPCAFYAAFGEPGPTVAAWLHERRYDVALNATWPASTQPNSDLLRVRKMRPDEELTRYLDFSGRMRNIDVNACAAGNAQVCAAMLHRTLARANRRLPEGVYPETQAYWFMSPLGSESSHLLSDLLAEQGRARFEKFWKSSGTLDAAFRSAFGISSGEWTMRWMQYRYGRESRGPYVSPRAAIFTLVTAVGIVALSAASAVRREIG